MGLDKNKRLVNSSTIVSFFSPEL